MEYRFSILLFVVVVAPLVAMLFSTFDLYSRCDESLKTQVMRFAADRKSQDIDFRTCDAAKAVTGAYAATLK